MGGPAGAGIAGVVIDDFWTNYGGELPPPGPPGKCATCPAHKPYQYGNPEAGYFCCQVSIPLSQSLEFAEFALDASFVRPCAKRQRFKGTFSFFCSQSRKVTLNL